MDESTRSRLQFLQAVSIRGEQDLARQRQLIDRLRLDGQPTSQAEDVLVKFERMHQALLGKLRALREGTA